MKTVLRWLASQNLNKPWLVTKSESINYGLCSSTTCLELPETIEDYKMKPHLRFQARQPPYKPCLQILVWEPCFTTIFEQNLPSERSYILVRSGRLSMFRHKYTYINQKIEFLAFSVRSAFATFSQHFICFLKLDVYLLF